MTIADASRRAVTHPARKARDATVAGIAISNPDKLFYPEARLSKLDLARY
jgi:hypothetical protein